MHYKYAHSDFHELNLDYILKLCRESLGIRLKVVGKELWLVNDLEEPLSKVTISYAKTALQDEKNNPITAYVLNAETVGTKLVLTRGNGDTVEIEIPYAKVAKEDIHNQDIDDYVYSIITDGDQLKIIDGSGAVSEIIVPFATKAKLDINLKELTTYAASLNVDGDELVLRDGNNIELNRFKVKYAERADKDGDSNVIVSTYANKLTTGTTTVKLISKDGTQLSEITVPYAISSTKDTDGNNFLDDYAEKLVIDADGQSIGVEAHNGNRLSTIVVPFAAVSEHANRAIETVSISGNEIVFKTYDGTSYRRTCPYSIKALNDDAGNEIKKTYVASIVNDTTTGAISFYAKDGSLIAEITPRVDSAVHDSYGNLIADFIKSISTNALSDYVTVTTGTGETKAVKIEYSTRALCDSLNNQIHNHYIHRLECIPDPQSGHYSLAAYNGEDALMWLMEIKAYAAQADLNGRDITTYIGNVEADEYHIDIVNGNDEIVNKISCDVKLDYTDQRVSTIHDRNVPTTFSYDSTDKALVITPGTALTMDSMLLLQSVRVKSVTFENEEV